MIRTNAIIFSRFFVGDERLATLAIPTLVRTFVDIASRSKLLPNILHRANMMRVSCADKIRRRNIQLGNHVLEIAMHLINVGLRRLILTSSLSGNFIPMFIHARLETYLAAVLPLIPRPHVRQHIIHSMPNVRQTVDIRNSGSDIGVLFSHDIYYITSLVKERAR